MPGGSARSQASIRVGTMHLPEPSILSASAGIGIFDRGPTERTRSAAVTTIELLSGGPPPPSIRSRAEKRLAVALLGGSAAAKQNCKTQQAGAGNHRKPPS